MKERWMVEFEVEIDQEYSPYPEFHPNICWDTASCELKPDGIYDCDDNNKLPWKVLKRETL
jgi:hypothetical protein